MFETIEQATELASAADAVCFKLRPMHSQQCSFRLLSMKCLSMFLVWVAQLSSSYAVSVSEECKLEKNVVKTRQQLKSCGFETVVVIPHTGDNLRSIAAHDTGLHSVSSEELPFPVVECEVLPGVSHSKHEYYNAVVSDQDRSKLPPCLRPALGREAVAYIAFLIQNYDNLPPHVIFIHGHSSSWHQDRPMPQLLWLVAGMMPSIRSNPSGVYLSLNNVIQADFEDTGCFSPFRRLCGSSWKRAKLEKAYKQYFEEYLGPLPEDMAHFCCAQFLVSKSRITANPKDFYIRALQYVLSGNSEGTGSWNGTVLCNPHKAAGCAWPGVVMEELWPFIFGDKLPFDCVSSRWKWTSILPWNKSSKIASNRFPLAVGLAPELMQEVRQNISAGIPITC